MKYIFIIYIFMHFSSFANKQTQKLLSSSNFKDVQFKSVADFRSASFDSSVSFCNVQFDTTVFLGNKYASAVYFYETKFKNEANFYNAQFNSDVVFFNTTFHLKAKFLKAKYNSNLTFHSCYIKHGNLIDFTRMILPDTLNFKDVSIESGNIDFTKSVLDSSKMICYINLQSSDIDNILLPYDRFKLYFPEGTTSDEKKGIYRKLLRKLKEEGMEDSYELLDKEYQKFNYKSKGDYLTCFFQNYWWNFGYNKERVFLYAIIFYLIFSLFNTWKFKQLTKKVYDFSDKKDRNIIYNYTGLFNRFNFSLFYTAMIFFGLKFKLEKLHFKELLNGIWKDRLWLLYFFSVYTLGLICLGFIANMVLG